MRKAAVSTDCGKRPCKPLVSQGDFQTGLGARAVHEPEQRRQQAQIIEQGRAQAQRQVAHLSRHALDLRLGLGDGLSVGPTQGQGQAGQLLTELVV